MDNILLALLTAAAVLNPRAEAAAGAKGAVLKAQWQPLCGIVDKLDTLDGQATKILKHIASEAKNASLDMLKLQIYFAAEQTRESTKFLKPLLAATASDAAQQLTTLSTGSTVLTRGLSHAAFLQGHIAEFLKLFGSAYATTGTLPCLAERNGGAGTASTGAVTKLDDLAAKGCKVFKSSSPETDPKITHVDDNGFTKLGTTVGLVTTNLGDTADACELTDHASGSHITGQPPANTIPYAAGLLRSATGGTATAGANPRQINTLIAATSTANDLQVLTDAHGSLNSLRKHDIFKNQRNSQRNIAELRSSSSFRTAVAIYLLGSKKTDGSDKLANIEATIDEKYGRDQENFTQKTWALVGNHKIDEIAYDPEGTKQKPLGEINDERQLALALQFYTQKTAAELAAKIEELEKTKDTAVNQPKDCSKLEKAECKPDVGCKYNKTTEKCEKGTKSTVVQANKETEKINSGVKCSDYDTKEKCDTVKRNGKKYCG
ncbi:variant surface glycoprotein (VSG), putative [Trypanosoma equiperdum]|uniref:Variant surface glycoprotein (VSG), putative n=1 Tax=Trypanosoma equiperdum TaxID=5694 RepID=A0A1G4IGE6_TRYEQ|nr:variant surface glycoprotein (VSG), putative [Trypanosoma equiperdum]